MTLLLFFAILLTPMGLLTGFMIWLVGQFKKSEENPISPTERLGKKIMWYSVVVFLVGTGSCWGLIGIESAFRQFFG